MSVVAAVDCGTNAIRLLIVKRDEENTIHEITRRMEIVRLGEGVDNTGNFTPAAIERTRHVLSEYVDAMVEHGVKRVRMVTTSATRDAGNQDDFFAMARQQLGRAVPGAQAEVITGQEEARLSFGGSVADLHGADAPFLVIDLGGGSTEFALGEQNAADGAVSRVNGAISLNIGCVRITERYLHTQPPIADEIAAARSFVREQLDIAFHNLAIETVRTWVGLAGTFTTIAALALGLEKYDAEKIHHSRISLEQLQQVTDELIAMTPEQRMELGPMHPGRADVIGGGAIVVQELASRLHDECGVTEVVVSEHDILDGLVHDLLHRNA